MSGFATDTTIETVYVRLPNGTCVCIELEHDGVNPDATVSCSYEEDNEVIVFDAQDVSYSRTVLIDGIAEESRSWLVHYEIRSSIDAGAAVLGSGTTLVDATYDEAADAAIDRVHETDTKADPRIDPFVTITRIEEADG